MFADDTKTFKGIVSNADRQLLRFDIENLVIWSATWKLQFQLHTVQDCDTGTQSDYIQL